MKLLIPSYGRVGRVTTAHLLNACFDECIIGVHTVEDYDAYATAQPELRPHLVITDVASGPHGANAQRAALARNFLADEEWACFADDNITALHGVRSDLNAREDWLSTHDPAVAHALGAKNWHALFKESVDSARFIVTVQEMIARAEQRDFWCCGFATNTSPMFRPRKWRESGYVSSKLMLWRNEADWPWQDMTHMDDFNYSAEQHLRHGGVLINHWLYPVAQHYASGGLGSYDSRVSHRQESVRLLLERYPGLLRVKDRPGFAPNTELAFRLHSPSQIDAWRRTLLTS